MRSPSTPMLKATLSCAAVLAILTGCGDDDAPTPDAGVPPVARDAGAPVGFTPDWTCDGSGEDCTVTTLAASGWLNNDGHTLARLADGRVVGWGVATRAIPEPTADTADARPHLLADLGLAAAVVAGGSVSCALREDGTVRCAGFGAIGDGSDAAGFRTADVLGVDDAVSIAAGGGFSCAARSDGTVVGWGSNIAGFWTDPPPLFPGCVGHVLLAPCVVAGVADAVQVVAGYRHACALDAMGHVDCWGANDVGQLGDGTNARRGSVVRVPGLEGVRALAAGGTTTCALGGEGSVVCWGYLGEGLFDIVGEEEGGCAALPGSCALSPTPVDGLVNITAIGVGKEHACGLDDTRTLRCWGGNRAGQLGTGDFAPHAMPQEVRADVRLFAVGRLHTCVETTAGDTLCTGDDDDGQLGAGDIASFWCFNVSRQPYPCSPSWLEVLGLSAR